MCGPLLHLQSSQPQFFSFLNLSIPSIAQSHCHLPINLNKLCDNCHSLAVANGVAAQRSGIERAQGEEPVTQGTQGTCLGDLPGQVGGLPPPHPPPPTRPPTAAALQNVAAWLVAGGLAYVLYVVPERKRVDEQQVCRRSWQTCPLRSLCGLT